jgi:hypothetical protein
LVLATALRGTPGALAWEWMQKIAGGSK